MTLDLPGFEAPVVDAQACFRALLEAMARPGTVRQAGRGLRPPPPLDPATGAVLLTLVDGGTPLWLDRPVAPALEWLAFHCGAVEAKKMEAATFVCGFLMPALASLATGSDAEPEESATLVLQVPALSSGRSYQLAGPGLENEALVRVTGLPDDFSAQWSANHALYPRGVDIVLCSGERICALPRSVCVREA